MGPKPRVVVLDLDGTIIGSNEQVSNVMTEKINELKANKYPVIIATGRTLLGCSKILDVLQPEWPVICFDGRYVYDYSRKTVLYSETLPDHAMAKIIAKYNTSFYIIQEHGGMLTASSEESRMHFSLYYGISRGLISVGETREPVVCLYMKSKPNQFGTYFKKVLVPEVEELGLEIKERQNDWFVIRSAAGDKKIGLDFVVNYCGFEMSSTIAIGDGSNDIEMLKGAGTSIAMLNGEEHVKRIATYVAGHVDEDGLLFYLEKILEGSI